MFPASTGLPRKPRALLVDLDDTLFDHRRAYLAGLDALRVRFPRFRRVPKARAAQRYRELLEAVHPLVLRGEVTEHEGRRRRFRALLEEGGYRPSPREISDAMAVSRAAYQRSSGATRGARRLLTTLRPDWTIIVVSNHRQWDQEQKLEELGLGGLVDALVTSERVGAAKPDPRPFLRALELARVPAGRAVVLGDSWESDVVGSRAAGIRPVWLNRYHRPAPEPGVVEIPALVPVARALTAIRGRPRAGWVPAMTGVRQDREGSSSPLRRATRWAP